MRLLDHHATEDLVALTHKKLFNTSPPTRRSYIVNVFLNIAFKLFSRIGSITRASLIACVRSSHSIILAEEHIVRR